MLRLYRSNACALSSDACGVQLLLALVYHFCAESVSVSYCWLCIEQVSAPASTQSSCQCRHACACICHH